MREAQEAPRFFGDLREVWKAAGFANDIEQIAMLAGRGVGPFTGSTFAGHWSLKPHEH
jgi:hypothetical protein